MVNYYITGSDEDDSPGVNEVQTALCGEVVNGVCACVCVCWIGCVVYMSLRDVCIERPREDARCLPLLLPILFP